jgi:MerR family transcriptional regulator, copper efflux regulator
MRIGELSKRTGIPVRTIRYYEQIGLLPEAERTDAGYRVFDDRHIQRARFVRRARRLGFSLDQIREILAGTNEDQTPCGSVRSVVQRNIQSIDKRISELATMRDILCQTLEELDSTDPSASTSVVCPVVEFRDWNTAVVSLDSPVEWRV